MRRRRQGKGERIIRERENESVSHTLHLKKNQASDMPGTTERKGKDGATGGERGKREETRNDEGRRRKRKDSEGVKGSTLEQVNARTCSMWSRAVTRPGVRVGSSPVLAWKMNAERVAAASAGVKGSRTFSNTTSVKISSSEVFTSHATRPFSCTVPRSPRRPFHR